MEQVRAGSWGTALARSLASTAAVFAILTSATLQGFSSAAVPAPGSSRPPSDLLAGSGEPLWKASYSERFPGCVSMILWPADEVPVALVTRSETGKIARVTVQSLRDSTAGAAATARAIGACR